MTEELKMDHIDRIIKIVQKAVEGDYSLHIEKSEGNDRIDRLTDAINRMIEIMRALNAGKKETEGALREREQQLSGILSASPVGIAIYDASGQCIAANDSVALMIETTREQMLRQNYLELESWKISGLLDMARTAIRTKSAKHHDTVGVSSFGKKVFLHCDLFPFGPDGLLFLARDITDSKQAGEALRDSYRRLDDIIDFLPDATFVIDVSGKVIAWNRSIEQMTGVSKADMIGKGGYEYAVPFYGQARPLLIDLALLQDNDFEKRHYEGVYRLGDTIYAEAYVPLTYRGKGASLWGTASRLRDASGNIIGAIESIRDVTDRKHSEAALRDSEKLLRDTLDGSPIPQFVIGMDHRVIRWNRAIERYTGVKAEDMVGTDHQSIPFYREKRPVMADLLADGSIEKIPQWYAGKYAKSQLLEGAYEATDFFPAIGQDGKWLYFTASAIRDTDGKIVGAVETLEDVTERKKIEESLRRLNRELRAISNCNQTLLRAEDEKTLLNEICRIICEEAGYFMAWVGYAENDDAKTVHPVAWSGVEDGYLADIKISWADTERGRGPTGTAIRTGATDCCQDFLTDPKVVLWRENALQRGYRSSISLPLKDEKSNILGVLNIYSTEPNAFTLDEIRLMEELAGDLAFGINVLRSRIERMEAAQAQEKLQAQLTQAQKMESIGRLAGGVAHDFNNMLGVITGYTEMALTKMDPDQPFFANLQEIRKAARRSADLTRQLLAFARKQTIAPRVLDLNETVESMLKILRRLIGEDIDLAWLPGKNLWPINMDPSQIDQILANLCVNARDAITGVGKVIIETGNGSFDDAYCAGHPETLSGEYVLLAVSDDGSGMNSEILDKLFEPFFTTKEMGKGTGLGLATIYGIVKQNNGFINVYSEQCRGTTFKIYLPRYMGKTEEIHKERTSKPAMGHETILLVEDDRGILDMTVMMLQGLGYTVLAASTPGDAVRLAREHAGEIHMLMTDVIMPEMNGWALAKNLLSLYPHLKILFMSGYTADVIAHHGVLEEGVNFIQKPFSMYALAAKLRETLDRPAA